jgi:hypothetical protein
MNYFGGVGLQTIKSIRRIKTSLLKEEIRISNQRISSNDLNQVNHNRDLGPSKIGALEAVKVSRCGLKFLFKKIGLLDHDQDTLQIGSILGRGEFLKCFSSIVSSVLSD